MAQQTEKQMTLQELTQRSEAARLRLTESHARLKHKLDLPARAKESVMEKPMKWLGGSLATGFMGSFLFRRKKTPEKVKELKRQRGFLLGALSHVVFDVARHRRTEVIGLLDVSGGYKKLITSGKSFNLFTER